MGLLSIVCKSYRSWEMDNVGKGISDSNYDCNNIRYPSWTQPNQWVGRVDVVVSLQCYMWPGNQEQNQDLHTWFKWTELHWWEWGRTSNICVQGELCKNICPRLWGGGVSGYILCVLGMCRPQGYVSHGFCLGRVLFSGPTVWQGVCFDPGLTLKFWQRS